MSKESYSVEAILSAKDSGFTTALNGASKSLDSLGARIKSGIGFGFLTSIGQKCFSVLESGISSITSHMDDAISRVDTLNNFPKVMQQIGFSAEDSAKAMEVLNAGVDGLPTSLDSITSSAQSLATLTGDLDGASKTAVALNDAFLASGSSSEDAARGLKQYSQMLSKGKVDAQSWYTLQETMGPALKQLANQFGYTGSAATNDLYKALQDGTITFDQLNSALVELDGRLEDGSAGMTGFAAQAKTATGGIKTSLTNIGTAVTRGLANLINGANEQLEASGTSIQTMLETVRTGVNAVFNSIAKSTAFSNFVSAFGTAFTWLSTNVPAIVSKISPYIVAIGDTVGKVWDSVKGMLSAIVGQLSGIGAGTTYLKTFQTVLSAVGTVIQKVAGFLQEHADVVAQLIKYLPVLIGAFAGFKVLSGITKKISGFKKALSGGGGVTSLTNGFAMALAKIPPTTILAIGAALAIAAVGFALIATQASGVAEILKAVGNVISTIIVAVGSALVIVIQGIADEVAMLAPIITGCLAVIIPVVTAALATILPLITDFCGTVLPIISDFVTTIATIIKDFWSTVVPIVTNFVQTLASTIITGIQGILTAAQPIVQSIGETIQGVADAVARVFETISPILDSLADCFTSWGENVNLIMNGVATIVTSVGETVSGVLDSIAGIFDSIGNAALNAGLGVQAMSEGIATLVDLKLSDLAATLAATATGLAAIGAASVDMEALGTAVTTAFTGISGMVGAVVALQLALNGMKSELNAIGASCAVAASAMTVLKTAPSGAGAALKALVAPLGQVATAAKQMGKQITASISESLAELPSVASRAFTQLTAAVRQASTSSTAAVKAMGTQMKTGFASALNSLTVTASAACSRVVSALSRGASGAYNAGVNVATGYLNGLRSMNAHIAQQAAVMANTVNSKISKVNQIGSPSRLLRKTGQFVGEGYAIGLKDMLGRIGEIASQIAEAPELAMAGVDFTSPSVSGIASLDSDYEYGVNLNGEIVVPVNLDGKEVARVTAPYTQAELNSLNRRADRKVGRV